MPGGISLYLKGREPFYRKFWKGFKVFSLELDFTGEMRPPLEVQGVSQVSRDHGLLKWRKSSVEIQRNTDFILSTDVKN